MDTPPEQPPPTKQPNTTKPNTAVASSVAHASLATDSTMGGAQAAATESNVEGTQVADQLAGSKRKNPDETKEDDEAYNELEVVGVKKYVIKKSAVTAKKKIEFLKMEDIFSFIDEKGEVHLHPMECHPLSS